MTIDHKITTTVIAKSKMFLRYDFLFRIIVFLIMMVNRYSFSGFLININTAFITSFGIDFKTIVFSGLLNVNTTRVP